VTTQRDLYDEMMLSYATGSLPSSAAMVVSAHLKLRPSARSSVHAYDRVGGALLDQGPLAAMQADAADVLARAASFEDAHPGEAAARRLSFMLEDPHAGRWRFVLPGMMERRIPGVPDASLLKLKAGRTVPEHDHGGLEVTLVLQGAFEDEFGLYERGDLVVRDEGVTHRPRVPAGEDCICLAATLAPIRPTSWAARIAQHFFA
jgi:putative transcriptional regulator